MAYSLINHGHRKPEMTKSMAESVRVSVSPSSSSANPSQDLSQFLLQNHSNFKRSGVPSRFMYYCNGDWLEFSNEVLVNLKLAFFGKKPMVDVEIGGAKYLFDFLRMLQTDLETGNQRSIAWIDVDGKCFFPKTFVSDEEFDRCEDDGNENAKIEIEIRIDEDMLKRKSQEVLEEQEFEVTSSNKQKQESSLKKPRLITTNGLGLPRWPNTVLVPEEEKTYTVLKKYILCVDPNASITALHQCVHLGPLERARFEVFQKQMEITRAARGADNTVYAWLAASAREVGSILAHGLSAPRESVGSETYGIGIYLSPVNLPHISAMQTEADENCQRHLVLCRVILGNVEKVEAGSKQSHPSGVNYDTGTDDPQHPKWFVVWCSSMNTHILPEFIVSYKLPDHVQGQSKGAMGLKFLDFLEKTKNSLPPSKVDEVVTLHEKFRAGKLERGTFIKQLRSVVGDDTLVSIIQEIRGSG